MKDMTLNKTQKENVKNAHKRKYRVGNLKPIMYYSIQSFYDRKTRHFPRIKLILSDTNIIGRFHNTALSTQLFELCIAISM